MSAQSLNALADALRGRLVQPHDADFDQVRAVWNGMVDRRPAAIAQCTGAADVIAAVDFAREQNMKLTVRGGNFGVVPSFQFALHECGPELMTAQIFHPSSDAGAVLRFYREFMANAPDEVAIYALCVPVPPVEPFPEDQHSKTAIALVGCYAGDTEAGRAALAPLADFGEPMMTAVDVMQYKVLHASFTDGAPDGGRYYWKSNYLNALSDEVIDIIADWSQSLPGPFSNFFIEPLGGAIAKLDDAATPFPNRSARFSFGISSGWEHAHEDVAGIEWTRDFHEALVPHATGKFYVNYLDRDEMAGVASAFGDNFERLQAVKAEYDPDGLFALSR